MRPFAAWVPGQPTLSVNGCIMWLTWGESSIDAVDCHMAYGMHQCISPYPGRCDVRRSKACQRLGIHAQIGPWGGLGSVGCLEVFISRWQLLFSFAQRVAGEILSSKQQQHAKKTPSTNIAVMPSAPAPHCNHALCPGTPLPALLPSLLLSMHSVLPSLPSLLPSQPS